MSSLPIAITCGDPSGVGPEVISAWLSSCRESLNNYCFIGPAQWLDALSAVNKMVVGNGSYVLTPGKPSLEGAKIAFDALRIAAEGCVNKQFSGVVTGPVNKHEMQQVGFHYPGQTEFFADVWGGEPVMAFAGGKLRVVLATWHIPLMQVGRYLTKEALTASIVAAHDLCLSLGILEPRIAVCGLNPHAGEGGLLGSEELSWINPLLQALQIQFTGLLPKTLPADTLFWRHSQGEFDIVVALYHDQGLAPLKLIDFDTSVNITLGLPFIRTSPDHGTAYNIAGKGIAKAIADQCPGK